MHYDIDYSKHKTAGAKRRAAIKDAKEWLSAKQWDAIMDGLQNGVFRDQEHFTLMIGTLCGIQGYPVTAIWETYAPRSLRARIGNPESAQ